MDRQDKKRLVSSIVIAGCSLAAMWLIHLVLWALDFDKTILGNVPRHTQGLLGILTSPLVHDDIYHLVANSGPFWMFMAAVLYFYRKSALWATIGIWLLSGIWVWLMAHPGVHIGVSGVVYGLGAFGFFSGVFRRDVRSISLSLLIVLLGGGMVWGIFPSKQGVSWESHLFGLLAGIGMAWAFRKVDRAPRRRYAWEDEPENDPRDENAAWNYRQNWPGSNNLYVPGEQNPQDTSPDP
jgi:membrane associated rhomboid family serine protease